MVKRIPAGPGEQRLPQVPITDPATTTTRGRVVVVGSINADWIVHVPSLPTPGQTVVGDGLARRHGGKGANQAVAAAGAGAPVIMVGAVGDDVAAEPELADLDAAGVDRSCVLRMPGTPTGIAMIAVDRDGENQITVAPGANASLNGEDVARALAGLALVEDDVVLVCNEVAEEAVAAAILAAHQAGARAVLNPAPPRRLSPGVPEFACLLTPNEAEARALSGKPESLTAALELNAITRSPVIVTCGANGAILVGAPDEDPVINVPAPECRPVDTVGAGDVFNGVLAARIAAGDSLRAATTKAVARATESTQWPGSRPERGPAGS